MKILSCTVENFGSYPELRFNPTNLGLALIHGPTGSGKSTLQDMICWVLYGVTSKNGNVDEVRSWTSPDSRTIGAVEVELPTGIIQVTRVRGKSNENDLFWGDSENFYRRGKDIKDTQTLLNQKLGADANLYLTAAYASEFSPTSHFFLANAKARRSVLETICDMDFPVSLAEKATIARKQAKSDLMAIKADLAALQAQFKYAESSKTLVRQEMNTWQDRQHKIIDQLKSKSANFTQEVKAREAKIRERAETWDKERRERLHSLIMSLEKLDGVLKNLPDDGGKVCPTCGTQSQSAAKHNHKYDLERFKEIKRELQLVQETPNPHLNEPLTDSVNPYAEQLEIERSRKNPHTFQLEHYLEEIKRLQTLTEIDTVRVAQLEQRFDALLQMADLSAELRGALLSQAVRAVQQDTNRRLSRFFDAEISVSFKLQADELEVQINKNGYDCTYTQLSKGQRQLLRLCFMTSVMEQSAANAGLHFDLLFFDEALDGLDADLKMKAFPMFEELAQNHGSVLVIEHSNEFKNLFSTHIQVTLENDRSIIEVVN